MQTDIIVYGESNMSLGEWFEEKRKVKALSTKKPHYPEFDPSTGLWRQCDNCEAMLYVRFLKQDQWVCDECGYHLEMGSTDRIDLLINQDTWIPIDEDMIPCDVLGFVDQKSYDERLVETQERTGLTDAIQTGTGKLGEHSVALGVMDFQFMGGSMGSVVGEKLTRLIERATANQLPLIIVCASGGARMQEGTLSLMQMAKITSVLQVHQVQNKLLYITILTHPTTGGVTASFGMLGDIIISEPQAYIAFAGKRVIEQTLKEELPEGFQVAESLLKHGLLDLIVPRAILKGVLSELLDLYQIAPCRKK
jgi:acetyl-CoA carboxylase carboxyl transferase subunit beta